MKIYDKIKEDSGVANSVSFMIIMIFTVTILISMLNGGMYFQVKNDMHSAAENGARNVAIYGGTDTAVRRARGGNKTVNSAEKTVEDSIPPNYKKQSDKGLPLAEYKSTECGPKNSQDGASAGNPVYCIVTYKYNGIAGKFDLFSLNNGKEGNGEIKVKGTGVSEVTSMR